MNALFISCLRRTSSPTVQPATGMTHAPQPHGSKEVDPQQQEQEPALLLQQPQEGGGGEPRAHREASWRCADWLAAPNVASSTLLLLSLVVVVTATHVVVVGLWWAGE